MAKIDTRRINERAYAETYDATQTQARPIAMLNITRTITDHIPLERDPNGIGMSLGTQIDNHLRQSAIEGHMIQTIALEFEPEDWLDHVAAMLRQR